MEAAVMAVTPEGKVKKMVNAVLGEFVKTVMIDGFVVEVMYVWWPVPSGFGASSLDCIICYYGHFIAIETKAPGKKPTPRQQLCAAQIRAAGGKVFVIDGESGCNMLRDHLLGIYNAQRSQ